MTENSWLISLRFESNYRNGLRQVIRLDETESRFRRETDTIEHLALNVYNLAMVRAM